MATTIRWPTPEGRRTLPSSLRGRPTPSSAKLHEPVSLSPEGEAQEAGAIVREGVFQRVGDELVDDKPQRHSLVERNRVLLGFDIEADRAQADQRVAQVLRKIGDEVVHIGGQRPVRARQAGMHFGHGVDARRGGDELLAGVVRRAAGLQLQQRGGDLEIVHDPVAHLAQHSLLSRSDAASRACGCVKSRHVRSSSR